MGRHVAREAVRGTQSGNRRREHRHAAGIGAFAEPLGELLLVVVRRHRPFAPVLELENEGRGIRADVAAEGVKAHHRDDVAYAGKLLNLRKKPFRNLLGPREG